MRCVTRGWNEMIDLFIMVVLSVGTLVVIAAVLLGVALLVTFLVDLFRMPDEDLEWDYSYAPPFNMNEEAY